MNKRVGCFFGVLVCGMSLGLTSQAQTQTASQNPLVFSVGLQQLYDSNFMRSPEEIDEQITRAGAGVSFKKQLASQRIALSINGNQYHYAELDNLNSSAFGGQASWKSQFTENISTLLDWIREETPVDKLEFLGKDLVARQEANARLSFGDSKRFGFILGAHQLGNSHSNVERNDMDFKDKDFFSEVRYRFASSSWLGLRYREGDRTYTELSPAQEQLDFDYRQMELETAWVVSPKTTLTGLVGYFDRAAKPGAVSDNDGEGTLASINMEWAITDKFTSELIYSFNQPAIGETSDAPSQVGDSVLRFQWKFSPKIDIGFGAGYSEFDYENNDVIVARTEHNITVTPLQVSWYYSDAIMLRLTSQWMDRHSPVPERDYQGYSAALALAFHF